MVDRTQRVKDARTESAKEIEAYKTQKEKEFKQFESEVHPPNQPNPGSRSGSRLGLTCLAHGNEYPGGGSGEEGR
jgi:Vacuolar (H+)-ATPase G subunit